MRISDWSSDVCSSDLMPADVALMKELGLKAYRFSVNWGRVLPEGIGRVNEPGLGFYERLVDELLKHDIEPLLTLHHWDLPAALDDKGGWLNRDSADWFAEYGRSEEHTSELQSLMRNSYAVFCLKKKNKKTY